MNLSRSSNSVADPLSAVLAALGAQATRFTTFEASGDWALAFPSLERLKFVAVRDGSFWLMAGDQRPHRLSSGDVALIGQSDYAVASDPSIPRSDGQVLFEGTDRVGLGGQEVVMLGGSITFTAGTAAFLLDMLPGSLVVESFNPAAHVLQSILTLLDREAQAPGPGSEAVTARLAELLVIEAIRIEISRSAAGKTGWLGALADPRLGRAIQGFHAEISRPWTVATLADRAGMSRAAFADAFRRMTGHTPNAYARKWRMTHARALAHRRKRHRGRVRGRLYVPERLRLCLP